MEKKEMDSPRSFRVTVRLPDKEEELEIKAPATYMDIVKRYADQFPEDIVLAYVQTEMESAGERLQELQKRVEEDVRIRFVTTAQPEGFASYRRSVCLLMLKALHDVSKGRVQVRIHFSLGSDFYCTTEKVEPVGKDFLVQVEERMRYLAKEGLPIEKRSVPTSYAVRSFARHGLEDKERLFSYRRASRVNLYSVDGYEDYFYGYMVPDTGYLTCFGLAPFRDGFLLRMPRISRMDELEVPAAFPKLFDTLWRSVAWGDLQGIRTVGDLNDKVTKDDMREIVLVQEAEQEQRIRALAKEISMRPQVRFVMIAGPSSSGKTTFSHRLSVWLRVFGLTPHPIAVDNYFVDREHTPLDEDGNYNFECLEAIDVSQFNADMTKLLEGQEVALPTFNFKTGRREYSGRTKRLGERDILVIEGIHCLNPALSASLADDRKFKIYISALTQLNIDEHNRIPSTDGRLIRRIIRDARTRGTSAENTILMWPSVRRGEEENIFPYQEEADAMFNSSLLYELAVLKQDVEPLLFGVDRHSPAFSEAKRLLKFFDYFVGIRGDMVPQHSILREFIGGGCFRI